MHSERDGILRLLRLFFLIQDPIVLRSHALPLDIKKQSYYIQSNQASGSLRDMPKATQFINGGILSRRHFTTHILRRL